MLQFFLLQHNTRIQTYKHQGGTCIYTDVQVQGQNLNTNKQLEVIINNELHCMSGNQLNFTLKHLQGNTHTQH